MFLNILYNAQSIFWFAAEYNIVFALLLIIMLGHRTITLFHGFFFHKMTSLHSIIASLHWALVRPIYLHYEETQLASTMSMTIWD